LRFLCDVVLVNNGKLWLPDEAEGQFWEKPSITTKKVHRSTKVSNLTDIRVCLEEAETNTEEGNGIV